MIIKKVAAKKRILFASHFGLAMQDISGEQPWKRRAVQLESPRKGGSIPSVARSNAPGKFTSFSGRRKTNNIKR